LTIEVSSGDPAATGIDLLETEAEGLSSVCPTRTRARTDCRASGEPAPRPRPLPLSDAELMANVSLGNAESFVDLYDRYYVRAYRVARSVCHDDGRAQEVVQDGFLSVWNSRANYRAQQGTVAAWVLTVVRYRAIDAARSNHRHASRRASDDQLITRAAGEDPSETAIRRDEAQRVQASLATLPDAQAEAITLAYYGQLSHTEIAAHLGVPRGTVKGRMRLGLQKLSADLKPAAA
jgi:RNA polymerase sigma-70 factor, ECF subfamily